MNPSGSATELLSIVRGFVNISHQMYISMIFLSIISTGKSFKEMRKANKAANKKFREMHAGKLSKNDVCFEFI